MVIPNKTDLPTCPWGWGKMWEDVGTSVTQIYDCNDEAFPLIKLIHIYGKGPSSPKEPWAM